MTESKPQKNKSRQELRFEREAKALQKNLAKRKRQQEQREQAAKEKPNGENQDSRRQAVGGQNLY